MKKVLNPFFSTFFELCYQIIWTDHRILTNNATEPFSELSVIWIYYAVNFQYN